MTTLTVHSPTGAREYDAQALEDEELLNYFNCPKDAERPAYQPIDLSTLASFEECMAAFGEKPR